MGLLSSFFFFSMASDADLEDKEHLIYKGVHRKTSAWITHTLRRNYSTHSALKQC